MADAPVSPGGEPLPSAFAPGQTPRERMEAGAERTRLTFRRLSGLDRSGPPPPATVAGQPLNPWTIPNAIGYVRLALIPLFVREGLRAPGGRGARPATLYAVVAWSDYADGIAARLTGQYSRMGALLDPLVDRLLVISGTAICWHHRLLPRPLLGVLVAREAGMLWLARWGIRRGLDSTVNWLGRAGVWPVMSAPFFAMTGHRRISLGCLYTGVPLMLGASFRYVRSARRQVVAKRAVSP